MEIKKPELVLIKYRDPGLSTFTYFWTLDGKVVSYYFDSIEQAEHWLAVLFKERND